MYRIFEFIVYRHKAKLFSHQQFLKIFICVTVHTFIVGETVVVKNSSHFMRLMTIDTNRNFVRFFFPKLAADYFCMNLFDLSVALCTSSSNIISVNSRCRIGVWKYIVRSMAACANSRNN